MPLLFSLLSHVPVIRRWAGRFSYCGYGDNEEQSLNSLSMALTCNGYGHEIEFSEEERTHYIFIEGYGEYRVEFDSVIRDANTHDFRVVKASLIRSNVGADTDYEESL